MKAKKKEPEWIVSNDGRSICSDNFTHDVRLNVDGDFESVKQRVAYANQLAHLLNAPSSSGWQPISTAPRAEGPSFLILRRGIVVQVSWFEGRLYPDARETCVDWEDGITDATHWQPLPPKPLTRSKE